jgi:spermidine synthase
VRSAGNTRRLYTNGAFHTQFNSQHLFTSGVWDLLSLPSLCLPTPPKKVLVLGVAGGTFIHQMCKMHRLEKLVGIELDSTHVQLATDYFQLDYTELELVYADARQWLESCINQFDYIVDDIFIHAEGDLERPYAADPRWLSILTEHLTINGTLVQNHIDSRQSKRALGYFSRGAVLEFSTEKYANKVLALFKSGTGVLKKNLRERLKQWPRSTTHRLRHRCRVISR